jgi:hypothetical protein
MAVTKTHTADEINQVIDAGATDIGENRVQELLEKSKEENGSLICAELLGLKGPIPKNNYVASERTAEYYKKRPCAAKVESAAKIFAEYLKEKKAKIANDV